VERADGVSAFLHLKLGEWAKFQYEVFCANVFTLARDILVAFLS